MKYALLLFIGLNACSPKITWDGNPMAYEIIAAYHMYPTDMQCEQITAHYMSEDGDPNADGVILMDVWEPNYGEIEISIDVYRNKYGYYVYNWSPDDGHEWKEYLTAKQRKHIIKL